MLGANGEILKWFGTCTDIEDIKNNEAVLEQRVVERTEALFRSRQTFKALADNAPDIIARYDRQYRHLFVSPRVEKVTGLTVADYIGKTNEDLGMPRDLCEKWNSLIEATFVLGKEQKGEFVFPSDGGPISYDIRLMPEFAPDGSVETVLSVARDITERKRVEEALVESERRLARSQEIARLGSWDLDLVANNLFWSDEVYRIFGLQPQEFGATYEGFLERVHPDDRVLVDAAYSGSLREGRYTYDIEHRVVRKDNGKVCFVHEKCEHIRDTAGRIIRSVGMVQDITERKMAEAALRDSERLYRAIGESIDYGIWVCDAEGRNTYASKSFLKLVGITQEQCSGMGWGDLLHPEDIEATMAAWTQCVQRGGPWYREHRFRGADGQWHPVLACGVAVRNERNEVTAWAGINLDIRRIKRAEEALRVSLREKEVLLKEVHHRVKNNMQVLSSLVSLQADALVSSHSLLGKTNNQAPMTTDEAARQALRGAFDDLRDQVRTMALVHEKLYQSESLAQVDFAEYARSLLDYLWRVYGDKAAGVRLTLDLRPVAFSVQTAVPCGLILNELATNALKHAYRDRMDGELTVSLRDDPDGNVCLCVRDNGVGFPAGLDWRHARSLGLQLVQMLVGQLEGTMDVRDDGGTAFQITFKPAGQGEEHV